MSLLSPSQGVLPARQIFDHGRHRPGLVLDWRAADAWYWRTDDGDPQTGEPVIQARSGHFLSFERAGTGTQVDAHGRSYSAPADVPGWAVVDGRTVLPVRPASHGDVTAQERAVITGIPTDIRTESGQIIWAETGALGVLGARLGERSDAAGAAPRLTIRAAVFGQVAVDLATGSGTSQVLLSGPLPAVGEWGYVMWQVEVAGGQVRVHARSRVNDGEWSANAAGTWVDLPDPAVYSGDRWHLREAHALAEEAE